MTHAEKILALLAERPGLDDDEISFALGIEPRQRVNAICRRLEARGRLLRKRGPLGKLVNFGASDRVIGLEAASEAGVARHTAVQIPIEASTTSPIIHGNELRNTLVLIPCSGKKRPGGSGAEYPQSLTDALPAQMAANLLQAQGEVLGKAVASLTPLLPAWQRYAGMFYSSAGAALERALQENLHILIISGGYGLITAQEPICEYAKRLRLSDWPRGLLEDVLSAYSKHHNLQRMRAFVSRTTDYARVVRRTKWSECGVTDAMIISPEACTGAMVKVPRAQGEALGAFLSGELGDDWRSSDGLRLEFERLH